VGYEFSAITSVVVGGTSLMGGIGNIAGTFVGALIIGVIDNVLDLLNVNSSWQQIVRGIIIALAVILDVKTKVVRVRKKA
jgi:inositol transport system permease protein